MKHNRVLVFSTDDHLYPAGGAEQAFGNITERLPHIEFDLVCAKLRKGAKRFEKVGNVNIYRMGFGIRKIDGIILALFGHFCARRLVKRYAYDFIWSIMASYGAFSAVRIKKRTGLPLLLTLQEGDSFEYIYKKVRYVRKQFNEIFTFADGIQAISHYLLRWGRDMGYKGANGRVIPNGVNVEAFKVPQSEQDIEQTRESFGFPKDAFILMTSSRLVKKNGIGDVITALARLPSNVCFVICGSGPLEEEIQTQVNLLGLNRRVNFLGFVQPEGLPLIMKASDAFIRPSLSEGLGNAFLEGFAARIPVIGSNAGGIPDFLTDGETGFVVGIQDPESIVSVVKRVMTLSPEAKQILLNRSERLIEDRYNWDLIAQEMEEFFNEITV